MLYAYEGSFFYDSSSNGELYGDFSELRQKVFKIARNFGFEGTWNDQKGTIVENIPESFNLIIEGERVKLIIVDDFDGFPIFVCSNWVAIVGDGFLFISANPFI